MSEQEQIDPKLWEIVSTEFTDYDDQKWMFRRITVRDMVNLEQEGLSPEKIAILQLLPLINLSYRFLVPLSGQKHPTLEEYQDILAAAVLDRAVEAFRGCLTNFFPRAQRVSARLVMQEQEKYLKEMAELQAKMVLHNLRKCGSTMESSDSHSTVPESSEQPPSTGPCENSSLPVSPSPQSSDQETPQSETPLQA